MARSRPFLMLASSKIWQLEYRTDYFSLWFPQIQVFGNYPMADELKNQHYEAIRLLIQGNSPETVGKEIGVTARTIYKWLNWEPFRDEYETQQRRLFDAMIATTMANSQDAISQLVTIAKSEEAPYTARVQAASKVCDIAIRQQDREIERRLERLENQLKDTNE